MNIGKSNHIGRNISCIRLLRVMQQEALALAMGVKLHTVIQIERSRNVEEGQLLKVADALGISVDGIRNFSEEAVIDYILKSATNVDDKITNKIFTPTKDSMINEKSNVNSECNCNTLHKLVDSYTENKKLYERLLDSEKDKVGYLEKFIESIKEFKKQESF